MSQTTTQHDELVRKFKKQGTTQLLARLEKQNGTHEELTAIKDILTSRNALAERLTKDGNLSQQVQAELTKAKLDWEIQLEPLCTRANDGITYRQHATLWWPTRLDTKEPLGRFGCSKDKPIMQNAELMDLGLRLAGATGATVTKAEALHDGATLLIGITAPGLITIGPDEVATNVYILDNRTGEHGLRIGFGDTVLRCKNQLRMVNKQRAHTLKHTKTLRERIEALVEAYDGLQQDIELHHERCRHMASTPVTEQLAIDMLLDLTGVDINADLTGAKRVPARLDQVTHMLDVINQQTADIGQPMTAWSILNGITYLTTHEHHSLYQRAAVPSLDEDLIYGKGGDLNEAAYSWLVNHLDLN